jgi:hypothetical protein
MTSSAVQLSKGFQPQDVRPWYDRAKLGEIITIALPSRSAAVRLVRRPHDYVCWWPEGERGMTMTLEEAMLRLGILQDTKTARRLKSERVD